MYNPPIGHYRHIKLSEEEQEKIYEIMGKEGNVFKSITSRGDAEYIWWNKELNIIEIWGPYHSLMRTDKLLMERIKYIMNKRKLVKLITSCENEIVKINLCVL